MVSVPTAAKQKIARQFSRSAQQYDSAAKVQKRIAEDAIAMLDANIDLLLDIGCGTGSTHATLRTHVRKIIGLDIAHGMLLQAQHIQAQTCLIAGDADQLPLQTASVDTVFSSMALQWCGDCDLAFAEIYRVLKPGGCAVLAIMSQGSLHQLQQVWQQVDQHRHINQFRSSGFLQQQAEQSGFKVQAQNKEYSTYHADIRALLHSIKSIGANVLLEQPATRLITKAQLAELQKIYQDEFDCDQGLPLGYSVCLLKLDKPDA